MFRFELNSLYRLLNKDDIELIGELRKEGLYKQLIGLVLYSILATALMFSTVVFINNFIIALSVALGILLLFFAHVFLVVLAKIQYGLWERFFEAKSISYNTRDFKGFDLALEDYISKNKNYYTDERSIDRRVIS